ncbi:hypothetical protein [Phytoactinopolyspora endophytica]|uniref:hypothetical protein n=1 Tax=Phytoactinopolyspora endophytica TaxID=1642495 RepID=UPI00101CBB4A|nr:hypothetical protein [Phytoactinopolyspora endophytica]
MSNQNHSMQEDTRSSRPAGRGGAGRARAALPTIFRRVQSKRGRHRSGRHTRSYLSTANSMKANSAAS